MVYERGNSRGRCRHLSEGILRYVPAKGNALPDSMDDRGNSDACPDGLDCFRKKEKEIRQLRKRLKLA